jgi:hypothetical protein
MKTGPFSGSKFHRAPAFLEFSWRARHAGCSRIEMDCWSLCTPPFFPPASRLRIAGCRPAQPIRWTPSRVSDRQHHDSILLRLVRQTEGESREKETANAKLRAHAWPGWPGQRRFANRIRRAPHLGDEVGTKSFSTSLVPVSNRTQLRLGIGVQLDNHLRRRCSRRFVMRSQASPKETVRAVPSATSCARRSISRTQRASAFSSSSSRLTRRSCASSARASGGSLSAWSKTSCFPAIGWFPWAEG